MNTVLLTKSIEIHTRLQELGVTEEVLREAVEAGERARMACTTNHPRVVPGLLGWSETVRVLRDRLMPLGWTKQEVGGAPTVVHPSGAHAIAVTTGDEGTGVESSGLRSKYAKGTATAAFVETNAAQLEFDRTVMKIYAADNFSADTLTWYIVIRRLQSELRFELALPSGIGEKGHVESWKERVMFNPISLTPPANQDENAEQGAEIVVDVTPRF